MQPVELDPEFNLALHLSTECSILKASAITGKTMTVFKVNFGDFV
jgi:hypothetical protein